MAATRAAFIDPRRAKTVSGPRRLRIGVAATPSAMNEPLAEAILAIAVSFAWANGVFDGTLEQIISELRGSSLSVTEHERGAVWSYSTRAARSFTRPGE
jgi:hypothetical protein